MFKNLMDLVFAGCTDTVDKFFCMMMFMLAVELFVGLIHALIRGNRK